MKLTRRQLVAGAAGAALGAAGIYELADQLSGSPARTAAVPLGPRPVEQHVLDGIPVVEQDGVQVIVPPRHHVVVTATVKPGTHLAKAQPELEQALRELESRYEQTPGGLGLTVAWGLPYFDRYVATAAEKHMPLDRRAQKPALLPLAVSRATRTTTRLEENDVALLLRSDRRDAHRGRARDAPDDSGLRRRRASAADSPAAASTAITRLSVAMAAGVPGADLIPTTPSSSSASPRRRRPARAAQIANFETLGLVDLRGGYFRDGTHMHLSMSRGPRGLVPQLRVPGARRHRVPPGAEGEGGRAGRPAGAEARFDERARSERDFHATGRIGHSASIQTTSRLLQDTSGQTVRVYMKGTAIPQRADFNTLDNPFPWSADPTRSAAPPAAGVHFVVFNPSSDDFHRNRLAMDGVLPGRRQDPVVPRARGQGFNSVLHDDAPPELPRPAARHRSFPLAEL